MESQRRTNNKYNNKVQIKLVITKLPRWFTYIQSPLFEIFQMFPFRPRR